MQKDELLRLQIFIFSIGGYHINRDISIIGSIFIFLIQTIDFILTNKTNISNFQPWTVPIHKK